MPHELRGFDRRTFVLCGVSAAVTCQMCIFRPHSGYLFASLLDQALSASTDNSVTTIQCWKTNLLKEERLESALKLDG